MLLHVQLVDVLSRSITPSEIVIEAGKIKSILPTDKTCAYFAIMGFIDAHVHIESSMLVPAEFARLAVVQGTIATVSDPHEIGNVLGIDGVRYMLKNAKQVPFKFCFGAPSCVPATSFETAGATITLADIKKLFIEDELTYLAEMMNYPAVIAGDAEAIDKINLAKLLGRQVDGHAPAVRGADICAYIAAGITTDHECITEAEAREKLELGMKVIIREGSAAKNFEALIGLLPEYPDMMMFCADDKHPDNLIEGHINHLAKRAVGKGINVFDVLKAACLNPVLHYNLPVGKLQIGDWADIVLVKDLTDFEVVQTYINGALVAENGKTLLPFLPCEVVNYFETHPKQATDFELPAQAGKLRVIEALDGQLVTNPLLFEPKIQHNKVVSDTERDILKIVVVNRYKDSLPAIAFVKNFGLKQGAIASSVAHDSHNIIAVGTNDADICAAINLIIAAKGGISAVSAEVQALLPLPVAGLMSTEDGYTVAQQYIAIDALAKQFGATLASPFMTLSFMALLVIPSLKLSDLGLFDGRRFSFTDLWEV